MQFTVNGLSIDRSENFYIAPINLAPFFIKILFPLSTVDLKSDLSNVTCISVSFDACNKKGAMLTLKIFQYMKCLKRVKVKSLVRACFHSWRTILF